MCPLVSGQDILVKNCRKFFISNFGQKVFIVKQLTSTKDGDGMLHLTAMERH